MDRYAFTDCREGFTMDEEMEYNAYLDSLENEDEDDYVHDHDGQPSEYDERQDYMGGDDWDHGQYDCCDW
jgi:hypothetical protein